MNTNVNILSSAEFKKQRVEQRYITPYDYRNAVDSMDNRLSATNVDPGIRDPEMAAIVNEIMSKWGGPLSANQ